MAATNRIIPKPSTFQVTDAMIAHGRAVGVDAEPEDRLVDEPEVHRGALLMNPNVGLNSQYHSRLETPRPMTTGTKTTARVNRRSGVLVATSRASR